jgi:hypothetical protein
MRLGDLAAENESYAGAYGFGSEERHKQVGGVRQARTFIFDQ